MFKGTICSILISYINYVIIIIIIFLDKYKLHYYLSIFVTLKIHMLRTNLIYIYIYIYHA